MQGDQRNDERVDDRDAALHQRLDDILSGNAFPSPEHDPRDARLRPLVMTKHQLDHERYSQPNPDFANKLGARLFAEMDLMESEASSRRAKNSTKSRETLPPRLARRLWLIGSRRRLIGTVAAAALLALVLGVATVVVAQATPDSPFYGVAQVIHNLETELRRRVPVLVSNTDQASQAQQQVIDAQSALKRLNSAIQQGDYAAYDTALQQFQDAYVAANKAITAVPAGDERNSLSQSLANVRTDATRQLHDALPGMSWDDRVLTTKTMQGLGAPTPDIRGFTFSRGRGPSAKDAAGSSLTVVIHGSGFAAGARVYVNGKQAGSVVKVSSNEIQVVVRGITSFATSDVIGVGNPDGMAVQQLAVQQGNRSAQATPQPSVEATSNAQGGASRSHD